MAPIKILTSFLCLFICMKSQDYNIGFRFQYDSSNYGITTRLTFVAYKDGKYTYCDITADTGFPADSTGDDTIYKSESDSNVVRASKLETIKL